MSNEGDRGDGGLVAADVTARAVSPAEAQGASRRWWDAEADAYLIEHATDLGDVDFLWCPEGLREDDARLLGDPASLHGMRVLELGCGNAPVSRWLAAHGAHPIGLDLSAAMLGHAAQANRRLGFDIPLIQADATAIGLADSSCDLAVSSFGAIAFIAEPATAMREVFRVLRPGGRWVFSTNHPLRWVLPDSPYPEDLRVRSSYFDERAYVEEAESGQAVYVETHRTMSNRVRDILDAGFVLDDLIEPEWVAGNDRTWGQWSPARGALVPGTVIFSAHKPLAA